jgi:hypothetical protein
VISITSPPNGAQVTQGQEVLVGATAIDSTGIARVELWVDSTLTTMAQPTSPQTSYPAVLHWTPTKTGAHTLMAKAINTGGLIGESAVIAVEVTSQVVPTNTPSATHTLMPPTRLPPTKAPAPPTQAPPPPPPTPCTATIDFRADRTTINTGESTFLRWDVECVQALYLDGAPVTGHESRYIAPPVTTTFTLHVIKKDSSAEDRQVTIMVNQVFAVTSANAYVSPPFFSGACPHDFNVSAVITTSGPGTVTYIWADSGGNTSQPYSIGFGGAGSQTVNTVWRKHNSGSYWIQIRTLAPNAINSNRAGFTLTCIPSNCVPEGGDLGPEVPGNTNQCCPGLVPSGTRPGWRGTCVRP